VSDKNSNQDIIKFDEAMDLVEQSAPSRMVKRLTSLSGLELKDYSELFENLPEDRRREIEQRFRRFSIGASAHTPLTCPASDICPHWEKCPYANAGVVDKIIGQDCPVEMQIFVDTVNKLLKQFEVTEDDYIQLQLITEYAELEIYDTRMGNQLSRNKHAGLIVEETAGMAVNGQTYEKTEISRAWTVKERVKNRKDKIMNMLIATPKDKQSIRSKNDEETIKGLLKEKNSFAKVVILV